MCKNNVNIRALKLMNSFCPSYFPLLIAKSFFNKLSPYFNLYLSAEIVNEIVRGADKGNLILLVLITVIGIFAIAIIVFSDTKKQFLCNGRRHIITKKH